MVPAVALPVVLVEVAIVVPPESCKTQVVSSSLLSVHDQRMEVDESAVPESEEGASEIPVSVVALALEEAVELPASLYATTFLV